MRIGDKHISPDSAPYIIAEIGVNHDGSLDRALQLVDAAAKAKADAVKLQLFETDRLLSRAAKLAAYQRAAGASDPFAMLRSLELPAVQMNAIAERAHELGLHAIVTVFSVELVELVRHDHQHMWDAFKTASPDVVNKPLLDALAATGKPIIISCGGATLDEIRRASEWIGDHPHLLMHCVSSYPTPEDEANLAGRSTMRCVDPAAIGYSDHTQALDTGALAVASGVRLLEKHLTYDTAAKGPDHACSLDAEGFAEYVRLAHRAFRMLGSRCKHVKTVEQDVRMVSRQSITSTRALNAGHVLSSVDLTIKRPGTGLPPWTLEQVIGRTMAHAVEIDMPLLESDLA